MALVKSGTHGSGSPLMAYELHAEQTAGSGTKRTIKMTLKAKVNGTSSASFFGYAVDYYFTVNGTKTTQTALKSSARWYANESYRSFTATVTVDVGTTSSKAITVGFTTVNSNGWGGSQSGSFTVGSTNTAPTWSSKIVTVRQTNSSGTVLSNVQAGTENATKFPENISALYLSWTAPTDSQGGTMTYEVYEQVDNGTFAKIATTTSTNYTRSIGSGSSTQGKMYDYYVKVKDSGGLYASGTADATQIQKNTLTVATPTSSSSIAYGTTSFTISWSGAKNTVTTSDANKSTFTYTLSSSNITVYNQTVTGSSVAVTIWRTGDATPTGCYVKFDDIKNYLKSSNYNGTITFTLKTANKYGSSGTKNVSIKANIQTTPTSFSFGSVSGTSTVNSTAYLIPANKQTTITWGASTDPLGGAITYDVYYSYDNGSTFTILQSGLTTNTLTKTLPTISQATSCKFKVTAKTTYGKSTSVTSGTQTLHYVGTPTIKITTQRNQTSYDIKGTVTIKTSIPNISLSSVRYVIGSTSTNLTVANPFTISRNLAEGSTESVTIYFRDKANADLGKAETSTVVSIGRYNPMLSIREKGVGVNCVPNSYKFQVNGSTYLGGGMTYFGSDIQMNNRAIKLTTENSSYPRLGYETSSTDVYISNSSNNWLRLKSDVTMTYGGHKVYTAKDMASQNITTNTLTTSQLTINRSAMPSTSSAILTVDTVEDGNAAGNGQTLLGWNSGGKYYHYFRGNGITYIDTTEGLRVKGKTLLQADTTCENSHIYVHNTTSGIKGHLWSGSGGFVVQGEANANLHLGANNQSNDIVIYGQEGETRRVQMNLNVHTSNSYFCGTNGSFSSNAGYVVLRSIANGIVYLQGSGARVTAPSDGATYRPILASAFTVSSQSKHKEEITLIDEDKSVDTMEILKSTNVYTYKLTDELENGIDKKKIGLIVEQATTDLVNDEEEGIELYQMASTLWDVCKKQQEKLEEQEQQISELREIVESLNN